MKLNLEDTVIGFLGQFSGYGNIYHKFSPFFLFPGYPVEYAKCHQLYQIYK